MIRAKMQAKVSRQQHLWDFVEFIFSLGGGLRFGKTPRVFFVRSPYDNDTCMVVMDAIM